MEDSNDEKRNSVQKEIQYYKKQVNELSASVLKFQYHNAEMSNVVKQMKSGLLLISNLKGFNSLNASIDQVYEHFTEHIVVNMLMDKAIVIRKLDDEIFRVVFVKGYSNEDTRELIGKEVAFPQEYIASPESIIVDGHSQKPLWIEDFRSSLKLEYFIITPVTDSHGLNSFLVIGRKMELKGLASMKLMAHDRDILEAIAGIITTIHNHIEQNAILERKVEERTLQLTLEKKKSDDLLLNILPAEVAEELKTKGTSEPHQYDAVSVLFTDFVGFTKVSEIMSAKDLVSEINYCYTAFDGIIEKFELEKIKTIGDAYMAVCGLPTKNDRHSFNTILAAKEIAAFVKKRKEEGGIFDIRIGIHSGSVVAGIVGVKKFAYDIWGDTVNTAARMEQNSEEGRINISGTTYNLVKDEFNCEFRGKIKAKNKGEVEMYFVN